MALVAIAALALALLLASCGGDEVTAGEPGFSERAEALLPEPEDFGTDATSEGEPRPGPLLICDLDSLFWDHTKERAASASIRDGSETSRVAVGVFATPAAAAKIYDVISGPDEHGCYAEVAQLKLAERTGWEPITSPQTKITHDEGGGSEATAIEVGTTIDLPEGEEASFTTIGVIRKGTAVYVISNVREDEPIADPLATYEEILE